MGNGIVVVRMIIGGSAMLEGYSCRLDWKLFHVVYLVPVQKLVEVQMDNYITSATRSATNYSFVMCSALSKP